MQGIAPLLILFRVAQGRAWTHGIVTATANQLSGHNHSIPLSNLTANGESSRNTESGLKVTMTTETITQGQWARSKAADV